MEYLERILEEHPEDGDLWLEYGNFLRNECDNPRDVLHAYETAQRLLPERDLRVTVGEALVRAGRAEEGLELIRAFLSSNHYSWAYCIYADCLIFLEMYHEAEAPLREVMKRDPNYDESYYLMGEVVREKSPLDAVPYYREALRLDPEYQAAWQGLGSILIAASDTLGEGLEALRRAIELDPNDLWATLYLANGLWKAGRLEEAKRQYEMAIERFPNKELCKEKYFNFMNYNNMN